MKEATHYKTELETGDDAFMNVSPLPSTILPSQQPSTSAPPIISITDADQSNSNYKSPGKNIIRFSDCFCYLTQIIHG